MSVESVLCFKIENHELIHHCFGFAAVVSPVFTDLDLRLKEPKLPGSNSVDTSPIEWIFIFECDFQLIKLRNFKKKNARKKTCWLCEDVAVTQQLTWNEEKPPPDPGLFSKIHLRVVSPEDFKLFHNYQDLKREMLRCSQVTLKAVCGSKRCFSFKVSIGIFVKRSGATIHKMIRA